MMIQPFEPQFQATAYSYLTTLTLRSINYYSLAALRAYSSIQYIQY
jgi:hypothetical protein